MECHSPTWSTIELFINNAISTFSDSAFRVYYHGKHGVWNSPKKSHSIASEASYVYMSGQKVYFGEFWKPEAGGQTVLPDRSTLIMTWFFMNERKCPDNTVCVSCVRPLFPILQAFFCYHPTCRKQRRYTRYSIVIIIKNLTPLWPQALEQRWIDRASADL